MKDSRRELFRGLLIACQAATFLATWPLWELRPTPALLSPIALSPAALPLPCGALLLATLALALFRPWAGAIAHGAMLAIAIALDESRFQPAVLSMALLLVASSAPERAWLGRAHLATQWVWAGIAKLASPAFFGVITPAIARVLPAWIPHRELAGPLAALVEISIGLLALHASSHRLVAGVGVALHLVIALGLAHVGLNHGAWAWNLALAGAALAFFGAPTAQLELGRRRLVVAALALSPALYYVGLLHPSLAHQLWAATTPTTLTCDVDGRCRADREVRESLETFGVPLPGRPGLLRAAFLAHCAPGERWLVRSRDRASYGEIVGVTPCHTLESSDVVVTNPLSGLNGRALSSYPGGSLPRDGVGWERP
jgi:hypothetical protein